LVVDHQYVWLRQAHHLLGAGTTVCARVYRCLCLGLVLRTLCRINMAHRCTHHGFGGRVCDPHLNAQRWCSVLRYVLVNDRDIQRSELATFLGNHARSVTSIKKGCPDRHSQLHQPIEPLVQPLLLPKKPGTILSTWRRVDHRGLYGHSGVSWRGELALSQTK
jgi:hypothetical protein